MNRRDVLKNIGAQAIGYGFGVLTNWPIEPIKLLPPLISYGSQAYDFVTQVTGATRTERIATLACLLTGTGLLSKTGDPVLNTGAGGFIFLYIALESQTRDTTLPVGSVRSASWPQTLTLKFSPLTLQNPYLRLAPLRPQFLQQLRPALGPRRQIPAGSISHNFLARFSDSQSRSNSSSPAGASPPP